MLSQNELNNFTGTEKWYRHELTEYLYTDGIKYIADKGGAYWLVDKILLTTKSLPLLRDSEFLVWKLFTYASQQADLICEDGNDVVLYSEQIDYTDFPLYEIKMYLENNTLCLPSER